MHWQDPTADKEARKVVAQHIYFIFYIRNAGKQKARAYAIAIEQMIYAKTRTREAYFDLKTNKNRLIGIVRDISKKWLDYLEEIRKDAIIGLLLLRKYPSVYQSTRVKP